MSDKEQESASSQMRFDLPGLGKTLVGLAGEAGDAAMGFASGFQQNVTVAFDAVTSAAAKKYKVKRAEQVNQESTLVDGEGDWIIPEPILSDRELGELEMLTRRYEKFIEPSAIKKFADKAGAMVPDAIRDSLGGAIDGISEDIQQQRLYAQVMEQIVNGFKVIEEPQRIAVLAGLEEIPVDAMAQVLTEEE